MFKLLVWLGCYSLSANAFLTLQTHPRHALTLAETKETLTFSVDYTLISDPIPAERKEEFLNLFQTNEICKSLLSAGGKRNVRESTLSPVFERYWDEISPGRDADSKLFFTDTDSKFPGLTLLSTICNGCNLVQDEAGRPKYEFVVLAEKQSVSGAPPVVWLFNKLTGDSRKNSGDFQKTVNAITSVASIVDCGDSIALQFVVDVKIYVVFPRSLLKILPTSKEKMEEQGSASMRAAIVKDIDDAVAGTVNAFLNGTASSRHADMIESC